MKQPIQVGARAILATAAMLLLLLAVPVAAVDAQEGDENGQNGVDVDIIVTQTQRLIDGLVAADLDDNDIPDFDASSDGIAELPLSDFADLQALPGSDEFSQLVRTTFELGVSPSSSETSLSTSCSAMVLSFDATGNMVDWALLAGTDHGGGADGVMVDLFPQSVTGTNIFTKENPFVVGDRIVLIGDIDTGTSGPSDHAAAWSASSAGVPLGNGGTGTAAIDGVVVDEMRIADHALAGVAEPVGVFPLDTRIEIADMLCQTSGWVRFDQGAPLLTKVGIAASGLSVLGALGLFLNARPARAWKTDEKA